MIKMVAIDMDGTLLNSQNQISKENEEALRSAVDAGVHVVIATGRNYADAMELLRPTGLILPVIHVNGASIHSIEGELIHSAHLDSQQAKAVHEIARREEVYHELFTDQGIFPCQHTSDFLFNDAEQGVFQGVIHPKRIKRNLEKIMKQIASGNHVDRILKESNVSFFKFVLFAYDPEKLKRAKHGLQQVKRLALSSSFHTNIEVNHIDGQKGHALAFMANRFGIPMEQTMAIGDNWNDLSMFQAAGASVAMGNAESQLAEQCDYITKHHDEHGVAHAFKEWILG